MISRFFGKTRPIHYIVFFGFLFAFHGVYLTRISEEGFTMGGIAFQILILGAFIIGVLFADQMAKKGNVVGQNSFLMLFWVLLAVLFPSTLIDHSAVLANLFILMAVYRLLEVKTLKNPKHKIFDATLSICISSLFCSWALLFFSLVFFSINTYLGKSTKNWLSVLAGIAAFLLLTFAVLVLNDNLGFFQKQYDFVAHFQTIPRFSPEIVNIKVMVFAIVVFVLAIIDFVKFRKKGGGKIIIFRFMLLYFLVSLLINALQPISSFWIIFSFMPGAVFLANYVETIKRAQLKEILLAIFILTPFILLFVEEMG
ncbi:DUF6427 family protein [Allomuricauda sp. SCSIO 65647]|uniref:DUF6427 family protein n=1 Tax=Allomuricauda sp. SCSIO 65647 TaxID=2908843 RepID=UPI001F19A3FA|nr:DUF6427 family protein [Muricauda sp. SCSIO 65647]UJH69034.1 DUF6427 family protein [Muricauda sp. SCSIO 65647]